MRIILLALQHWHEAPVSPLAAIDRHDFSLQPLQVGILWQPLEAFRVFPHTHLEITLKLVRRESVCAAQDCPHAPSGPENLASVFGSLGSSGSREKSTGKSILSLPSRRLTV